MEQRQCRISGRRGLRGLIRTCGAREERQREGGGSREQLRGRRCLWWWGERLEELADDPEGELALQLEAARTEDGVTGRLAVRADRLEQPRLADPGRTLDDHETPVAAN